MRIWIDDKTKSGVHIRAEITDDKPDMISVDGVIAKIISYRHYRDGGTRIFVTDKGTLKLPHKIGVPDHHPRWNGEDIGEPSQEILEWRERNAKRLQKFFTDIYRAESGERP